MRKFRNVQKAVHLQHKAGFFIGTSSKTTPWNQTPRKKKQKKINTHGSNIVFYIYQCSQCSQATMRRASRKTVAAIKQLDPQTKNTLRKALTKGNAARDQGHQAQTQDTKDLWQSAAELLVEAMARMGDELMVELRLETVLDGSSIRDASPSWALFAKSTRRARFLAYATQAHHRSIVYKILRKGTIPSTRDASPSWVRESPLSNW